VEEGDDFDLAAERSNVIYARECGWTPDKITLDGVRNVYLARIFFKRPLSRRIT